MQYNVVFVSGVHVITFADFSQLSFVTSCLAESRLRSTSSSCHQHVYNEISIQTRIPLYKHACLDRISLALQPFGSYSKFNIVTKLDLVQLLKQSEMNGQVYICEALFLLRVSVRHDVSLYFKSLVRAVVSVEVLTGFTLVFV